MDPEVRIEHELHDGDVVEGELVDPNATALTTGEAAVIGAAHGAQVTRAPAAKLQTAAAAATGFVAGAATLALLRHYGAAKVERLAQQQNLEKRRPQPLAPGRTTTYIVHVRPLVPPE